MAVALVGSNVFAFADGGAGHVCSMGSAPNANEIDVFFVNSDTTISTPSGFTVGTSNLNSQASAAFWRKAAGGEASSVTITTGGNFNAEVQWSRWSGLNTIDLGVKASVAGSSDTSSLAINTGALAEATELVLVFAALHSVGLAADQNTPVWSSGYTALTGPSPQGTGASGVNGFVGYKVPAGTAAETPSVSWSGSGVFDRDTLVLTFTAAAVAGPTPTVVAGSATVPTPTVTATALTTPTRVLGVATVPTPSPTGSALASPIRVLALTTVPPPVTAAGAVALPAVVAASASIPTPTIQATLSVLVVPGAVQAVASVPAVAPIVPGGVLVVAGPVRASVRIPYPGVSVPAVPTPEGPQTGNWWKLYDIYREASEWMAEDLATPPVACPNDGEPLLAGPQGQLYCPFDGWQPE